MNSNFAVNVVALYKLSNRNRLKMRKQAAAMVLPIFCMISVGAIASDRTECTSYTFPAAPRMAPPIAPRYDPALNKVVTDVNETLDKADGFYAPKQISPLDMRMFGVQLGKPYSIDQMKDVLASLGTEYAIPGNIVYGSVKDRGHRYTGYYATGREGGISLTGYVDEEKQEIILTRLIRKNFEGNLDWQGLKEAVTTKFGHGIVAAGSNQVNYAARYSDGLGGWYQGVANSCEGSDACEGTVRFKHRNKFIENNSGGLCVTDLYEINMFKVDVDRKIRTYEMQAAENSSKAANDGVQLSKPKM